MSDERNPSEVRELVAGLRSRACDRCNGYVKRGERPVSGWCPDRCSFFMGAADALERVLDELREAQAVVAWFTDYVQLEEGCF